MDWAGHPLQQMIDQQQTAALPHCHCCSQQNTPYAMLLRAVMLVVWMLCGPGAFGLPLASLQSPCHCAIPVCHRVSNTSCNADTYSHGAVLNKDGLTLSANTCQSPKKAAFLCFTGWHTAPIATVTALHQGALNPAHGLKAMAPPCRLVSCHLVSCTDRASR